jgi:hypothetical protein
LFEFIFKENPADLHNQSLKPLWLVYGFNKHNFGGEHHSTIWTKFSFIPSSGSEEENFQSTSRVGNNLGCQVRSLDTIITDDHP